MSDLSALPDFSFCETDASKIESNVITKYEKVAETSLAAGDPVRLFLESLAYTIAILSQLVDYTGKQNLLAFANNEPLDHLGALMDSSRLQPTYSVTTIRFSLGEIQSSNVIIPAGTRVTPDNSIMFVTDDEAEIVAGTLCIDVAATCDTAGTGGNGFLAGQINRLVDPISGVKSVVNTVISLGGAEIEVDDRYRDRVQLSPESASVAGPSGAYEYHAKSAHQNIADVAVLTLKPGTTNIFVLMNDGELPTQDILDAVYNATSPKKVRPLTDHVVVSAPDLVEYQIVGEYFISNSKATLAASIQSAAETAVEDFIAWQKSKIGRDINTAELVYRLRSVGVKRINLSSPIDTVLTATQVAVLAENGLQLTYGGLEDE